VVANDGQDRADAILARLDDIYEGRRKYPRVVIDRPLYIHRPEGESLRAVAHDISPDGLKIVCDRETAKALHPSGKFIKKDEGPLVEVTFSLPLGQSSEEIGAACQLRYIEVIPDNKIAFGLKFKELKEDGEGVLSRYIAETMRPVEEKLQEFLDQPRSHEEISEHMDLEPRAVSETLSRLKQKGDVISCGPAGAPKHVNLSATVMAMLKRLGKLEKRMSRLEKKLGRK
jgi:hypothetical protein